MTFMGLLQLKQFYESSALWALHSTFLDLLDYWVYSWYSGSSLSFFVNIVRSFCLWPIRSYDLESVMIQLYS